MYEIYYKNTRLNLEATSENSLKLFSRAELSVHSSKFFQQDLEYFEIFLKSVN